MLVQARGETSMKVTVRDDNKIYLEIYIDDHLIVAAGIGTSEARALNTDLNDAIIYAECTSKAKADAAKLN